MKRTAYLALVLLVPALAGCGNDLTPRWSEPARSAPSAAPSSPGEEPGGGDPGEVTTDVKECFDGECVLEVSDPTVVPLHIKFRISRLEIVPGDGGVTINSAFPSGGGGQAAGSVGTTLTINELTIVVRSVEGDTAVLEFSA